MDKKIYFIVEDATRSNRGHIYHEGIKVAPVGYKVTIEPPKRTLDQNAKMWPMLDDVARQVVWYGQKLTTYEWKDVFSAALKRQKVVPGLDGGFVVCGQSTSKMNKSEMSDMIELMYGFGSQQNPPVIWSDTSKHYFEQERMTAITNKEQSS
jgi:hypothetical protein